MKAWTLPSLTGIGALQLLDLPDPVPAAGELLVDVAFAALNPADRYLAEGAYPGKPTFPHILGRDGLGTVAALGAGVTGFKVGETVLLLRSEVGVTRWGTFAQKVTVPAIHVTRPPSAHWTPQQCAAAPLVYMTAHQALTQWDLDAVPVPKGGVVLVSGASGGVGVATVQLAKALGRRVIGLSRSAEKAAIVRTQGAELTFDPNDKLWSKNLRAAIAPAKVDLVVDNIGGTLFPEMIDCLAMHGRVSCVGRLGGPVPNFNPSTLFFRRLRIGGVAVATYSDTQMQTLWPQIVGALDGINARPLIDQVFGFDHLPAAFARLQEGPMGKVLIAIN
jgi:NADPH2:quinone reductase